MEYELGKPCPYCGEGSEVRDGGAVGYYCSNGLKCKAPRPWDDVSYGSMARFEAPKHLRKGQALNAFLTWCDDNKNTDSFYATDDQLETWWNEWVTSLRKEVSK